MNFNYFLSETVFEFLLKAVEFVTTHGWKFLPDYRFDPETGQWRHRRGRPMAVMTLGDVSYRSGKMEYRTRTATDPEWVLEGYLEEALTCAELVQSTESGDTEADPPLSEDFEHLRWFPLPGEILQALRDDGDAPLSG
jgi:hypothetical protein